jgi:hypothetical protein
MAQRVAVDPCAGVANRQHDVGTGPHVAGPSPAADLPLVSLYREYPTRRHPVPGVQDQVHQHLFQVPRVDPDRAGAGTQPELEPDIGAEQPLDQALHAADDPIQMEHPGLERLLAAEGEELAGEQGTAVGRLPDLLDVGADPVLLGQVPEQQLAEPADGGEQVVEVVGHPARQPAHRVEPLGLPQLLLPLVQGRPGPGPVADVGGEHQPGPPAIHLERMGDDLHVHDGAVLPLMPRERRLLFGGCPRSRYPPAPHRLPA